MGISHEQDTPVWKGGGGGGHSGGAGAKLVYPCAPNAGWRAGYTFQHVKIEGLGPSGVVYFFAEPQHFTPKLLREPIVVRTSVICVHGKLQFTTQRANAPKDNRLCVHPQVRGVQ